ncbi:uncharacterized protein Hap1MRO34_025925 isoform 1-T2 [Clarias gariepinus]
MKECLPQTRARAPAPSTRRGRNELWAAQGETIKAHQSKMETQCKSYWRTEYTENFSLPKVYHPPRTAKKTAHHLVSTFQISSDTVGVEKGRRTEYQARYGHKENRSLTPHLEELTGRYYAQASSLQHSLLGKRERLIKLIEAQKTNASGNAKEAPLKSECMPQTRTRSRPTGARRGRRELQTTLVETLEPAKAYQADVETHHRSRPVSANATNFAFRQSVHPPRTSMRSAQSGDSPKEPTGLISEKFQCTEYEAVYGPKEDQSLPPRRVKSNQDLYSQASQLQDSVPVKEDELVELIEVRKFNISRNSQESLSSKKEYLPQRPARAPPPVPIRGRRELRPTYGESVKPKKPLISMGLAHPLDFPSRPASLFAEKYRYTEYQAIYGPKVPTAHFNVTLFRQLRGTS